MEYFKIFGIEPIQLSLDLNVLEKKFYDLSLKHHPDRNKGSSESVEKTAQLNQAYKTLKDQWGRALYIFEALGHKRSSKVPPAVAEIYFELQEAEDIQALANLRSKLTGDRKEQEVRLQKLFELFDKNANARDRAIKEIGDLINEKTYVDSILQDIETGAGK